MCCIKPVLKLILSLSCYDSMLDVLLSWYSLDESLSHFLSLFQAMYTTTSEQYCYSRNMVTLKITALNVSLNYYIAFSFEIEGGYLSRLGLSQNFSLIRPFRIEIFSQTLKRFLFKILKVWVWCLGLVLSINVGSSLFTLLIRSFWVWFVFW